MGEDDTHNDNDHHYEEADKDDAEVKDDEDV